MAVEFVPWGRLLDFNLDNKRLALDSVDLCLVLMLLCFELFI